MQLSSRNQLPATIRGIKLGNVMAEVVMEIDGGHEVVSAITRASVEHLGLEVGQRVVAVIKATEVMVGRE
ncbi:MAG TPA: TOBE domain-containing protein [Tepidiformaceae bacterium]|nr:TOBE domain-containing protein [Tepidiformaceae bacterium]